MHVFIWLSLASTILLVDHCTLALTLKRRRNCIFRFTDQSEAHEDVPEHKMCYKERIIFKKSELSSVATRAKEMS